MKIEHFALNVTDPRAMADWYVTYCGLRIAFRLDDPPYTRFLADQGDHVMIEIYCNPKDPIPDYAAQHPLRFHVAFTAADPSAERKRLEAAGATFVEDIHGPEDSYHVVVLRDPWGLPIQLCRRAQPMI